MKRLWLTTGVGALPVLGVVAFVGWQTPGGGDPASGPVAPAADTATGQPIQFPHDTHAGQFLINCQYCHFSAERSVDAGIPPVESCMGCHREGIVNGRNNPEEIVKLREYHAADAPIPWRRIYKVSDHVVFPHFRHVAAGVACQTCHGQVQDRKSVV